MAYNMLLTHIPASSNTVKSRTALRREDYPNVRFWTRQDWNSAAQEDVLQIDPPEDSEVFPELEEGDELKDPVPAPGPACRGKHRASQGINVTMKYIEFEDGTTIDGFRAAEIRRYARSLWVQMALDDKLPRTWSDADAKSLTSYNESMAQRFPELCFCVADWKANMVATDNYPSWRHNWLKKNSKDGRLKRHGDAHSEASMKKPKIAAELSDELRGPILPEAKAQQVDPFSTVSQLAIFICAATS